MKEIFKYLGTTINKFMRRKTTVEYGFLESGYGFFLFYNQAKLDLRKLIQKFPEIIEGRHLLVTSISSGKIEKQMFDSYIAKGVSCEYAQGNIIVNPEHTKDFIHFLFSHGPGGSTIYFLHHKPHAADMENKTIYGIPALPVSVKILKAQRIDKPLLDILLREIDSMGVSFYYDNNWNEAICVTRRKRLFEEIKVYFHYNNYLREIHFA
ncbi:MAG: hypothetical protein AMJ95_07780 [Omnitrophica WOR_2 bacterium SM23_72]|nr:MAG: hypothetical protein AMJ95_07780 [Omnitrophica WOR_2 bacterium SM23_72]